MSPVERRRRNHTASPVVPSGNESFENSNTSMDMDMDTWHSSHNNNNNGLHHRHAPRSRSESSEQDDSERGVVSRGPSISKTVKRQQKRRLSKPIQKCLLMGIPAYLVLIVLLLKTVNDHQRQQHSRMDASRLYSVRSVHEMTYSKLLRRLNSDSEEWERSREAYNRQRTLHTVRRERLKPKTKDDDDPISLASTVVLGMHQHERPVSLKKLQPPSSNHAALDEICGYQTQNAALEQGDNFLNRDALNTPKTRVLITGALHPLGFLLALALKEKCNVQVIAAFDNMYPNSLSNRLRLQEPMAILTKNIPKLVKPIFLSHLGLDPVKHSKNFKVLEGTLEMDVLQTLSPTHIVHLGSYDPHAFSYHHPEWKNEHSPYQTEALFRLRSGLLSMEQILGAMAAAPDEDRPHFLYAGIPLDDTTPSFLHSAGRKMDEVLADYYYQTHGVFSASLRLPNAILGPWGHPESPLYQFLDPSTRANVSSSDLSNLDLLHADDLIDGLIAAMQYRPTDSRPTYFDFSSGKLTTFNQLQTATTQILDPTVSTEIGIPSVSNPSAIQSMQRVQSLLGWVPRVSLLDGLVRTLAWHLDRQQPYGSSIAANSTETTPIETGDRLLERHGIQRCKANDLLCHTSRPFLPCASECSIRHNCVRTVFDDLVPKVQSLSEECDIVLYTQDLDAKTVDLELHSEFMDEGSPLVCNFAFVNGESQLVRSVIDRVPEGELANLGFEMTAEDENLPGGMWARKQEKLNGRLLYRGWILVWTVNTPSVLSTLEEYFLKLSPGRLFHSDVETAVFIDQSFGVSPSADDVEFLAHEMHRPKYHARVVKRKTRPKAKFLLPPEPERQAVVLMSELKYQDSSDAERLSPDEKISTYEATRFMRYSNGEEPLGKEPQKIKMQREFYDRLRSSINPDNGRAPSEPVHKFEMKHWVRSRWVAHDLSYDESRLLRCDWYQEHVLWGAGLDQLSFAYVMAKAEMSRKLARNEPDDTVQKHLAEKTEMKKLLSDTFEWHALDTDQNSRYSPFEEMSILPFELDNLDNWEPAASTFDDSRPALFARILSDRIMAYARKSWGHSKKVKDAEL